MTDLKKNLDVAGGPATPSDPGRSRPDMLQELIQMSSTNRPLNIRFSKENNMQGKRIKLTEDGDDIKITFVTGAREEVFNKMRDSEVEQIEDGIELTQYYADVFGTVHKIVIIVLSPPGEAPAFFYYIVHEEPDHNDHPHHQPFPFNTSEDETISVEARRVIKLTHQSTHGGGRG